MKTKIQICLSTTALSILLLSMVATVHKAQFLCINTVYEILLANIVIHLGLYFLERFESSYFIIEILVVISYILTVLILFGLWFNWYESLPLWLLILLGMAVYLLGSFIDIFRITHNLTFINNHLKSYQSQNKH